MTMKRKQPRWTAGFMADVSQPACTTNQSHPQPQPLPQSQSESQSHPLQPLCNNMTPTLSFSQQSNHELQSSSGAASIGTSTGQSTSRQTRGPGRPFAEWGMGQKLKVTLSEENQPIGDEAAKLQSQLGILARNGNFAPLTFNDWRAPQLNPYKERIWQEVKENTDAPNIFKHNCLMSVGKKWKDQRKRKHFNKYKTNEERLANCPDRVDPSQWKILVQFWNSLEAQERSTTNSDNRKKLTMSHTSGRKAHCRVKDEMYKRDKVQPDRIMVYIETHTKKNGDPVDEASDVAISRLKEGLSQVPESLQTEKFREELFTEVLGVDGYGRVRTYGLGPCPSQVFETRYSGPRQRIDMDKLRIEVREEVRQELLAEWGERFTQLERKCDKMQAHVETMGYPMPQSPSMPSHIGGNGSRPSFNMQQVPDASSSHQLNEELMVPSHEVGQEVELLTSKLPKQVVAIGIVISKDPSKVVGGQRLGPEFWEVRITKAIKPRQNLVKALEGVKTIGDALHKCVAWPSVDIEDPFADFAD